LRVDKIIKVGTTVEINREVGGFETDQKSLKFNTQIVVIEKDLLFNDVGQTNLEIKIDATIDERQEFSREIEIKETRSIFGKIWGNRTAVFEIILEAKVFDALMCVPMTDDGWFQVVLEKNNKTVSLPSFLQIKPEGIVRGRERLVVLEGAYRGEKATAKLLPNDSSYFIPIIKYEPVAIAKYSISQKIFTFNGKEHKATDHPNTLWKKGIYDIEIPSSPHQVSPNYLHKAKLAKVWFLVGHAGERFLHTGTRSLGCMTIIELEIWDKLCETLLKSRRGDFISVGIIEVID